MQSKGQSIHDSADKSLPKMKIKNKEAIALNAFLISVLFTDKMKRVKANCHFKNTTCACTHADRHKNQIKEKMNQILEKKLSTIGRDYGASLRSLM